MPETHEQQVHTDFMSEQVVLIRESVIRIEEQLKSFTREQDLFRIRLDTHSARLTKLENQQNRWGGALVVLLMLMPFVWQIILKQMGY